MSYPEYRSWQLFALLEPFGFEDNEYHWASLMSLLYNINKGKKKARTTKSFMRNMLEETLKELEKRTPRDISEMSREELLARVKKDFGN
jgi:hypothetical protein